ncbi:hypothetical protein [Lentzea sp. CC55]|uniref:hypothetical protein n=1 Tax=Lentzea sp. CC55 TaxID=2884909 RepID=UPI001F3543C9|nr:hypothetical protein [Lentzea sp. CC55]MCG8925249.1 hypothetical protein [Lentzea sp. CC55]
MIEQRVWLRHKRSGDVGSGAAVRSDVQAGFVPAAMEVVEESEFDRGSECSADEGGAPQPGSAFGGEHELVVLLHKMLRRMVMRSMAE